MNELSRCLQSSFIARIARLFYVAKTPFIVKFCSCNKTESCLASQVSIHKYAVKPVVCMCCVSDFSLKVHWTGTPMLDEETVRFYFPAVHLDRNETACLHLDFTHHQYLAVQLVHSGGDALLLYSTGTESFWQSQLKYHVSIPITPYVVDIREFIVVLSMKWRQGWLKSNAFIKNIQLVKQTCESDGKSLISWDNCIIHKQKVIYIQTRGR